MSHRSNERLVDRLQSNPHYGEKWVDSGSTLPATPIRPGRLDPLRFTPLARLLIDAIIRTTLRPVHVEQIAGDLLPNPTTEHHRHRIHRNR